MLAAVGWRRRVATYCSLSAPIASRLRSITIHEDQGAHRASGLDAATALSATRSRRPRWRSGPTPRRPGLTVGQRRGKGPGGRSLGVQAARGCHPCGRPGRSGWSAAPTGRADRHAPGAGCPPRPRAHGGRSGLSELAGPPERPHRRSEV